MMRRILRVLTLRARMVVASDGPFIESRFSRVLVLSALGAVIMSAGLLAFATSARADVACDNTFGVFCLEKTATPDPVEVGEVLTFTIRGHCNPSTNNGCLAVTFGGLTDTLPAGVEFVSASATGYGGTEAFPLPQPTCSESQGTVTCAPAAFFLDTEVTEVPFVATIEVIPRQCGTFTNTANWGSLVSVSETFTVVGCVPTSEEQCKEGGYAQFGFANQGRCIKAVKTES